jgi:hypothetical protein
MSALRENIPLGPWSDRQRLNGQGRDAMSPRRHRRRSLEMSRAHTGTCEAGVTPVLRVPLGKKLGTG